MALVHLRALATINTIDESGQRFTVHKGDWFKVGKQRAIELIETRQAELPANAEAQRAIKEDLDDCGILVLGGSVKDARAAMGRHTVDALESTGRLYLPWDRTLIWDVRYPLEARQVALGFVRVQDTGRYNSWEMAAMLQHNEMLASDVGEAADQQRTREAVGDLRLPVYNTLALWVRKTAATEALVDAYAAELAESQSEEHAFLRALYRHRVLLCTLPAGWLRRLA